MYKFFILAAFIIHFNSILVANSNDYPTVHIDTLGSQLQLTDDYLYFIDTLRTTSFDEITKKTFLRSDVVERTNEAAYWFKFKVDPKNTDHTFVFGFNRNDFIDLYVPYRTGYQLQRLGGYVYRGDVNDKREKNILSLQGNQVDFSMPFYYKKEIISYDGNKHLDFNPVVAYFSTKDRVSAILFDNTFDDLMNIFLGLILMSFLLFLISFTVTRDKNSLIYSLYLLSIFIYFINRLPMVTNQYGHIGFPELEFYINPAANIANMGLYFYFAVHFINFKGSHPSFHMFCMKFLKSLVLVGAFYMLYILINPYDLTHIHIMNALRIVFAITSILALVYLYFQKTALTSRIVVVGSLLLILGSLLSTILGDYNYFLPVVIVETILFSWVVSYQNKLNEKEHLDNKYALEKMHELDALKSRFFANISHEFRTPLTLILGPLETMLKGKTNGQQKELKTIHQNASRLHRLIDQILDLSRLNEGASTLTNKEIPLVSFSNSILSTFDSFANQKNINYTKQIDVEDCVANIDVDKLEKILYNLISNAFKFTPGGGDISVSIGVSNYYDGEQLLIKVKDSGIGLEQVEIEKIFERFYQTKESIESEVEGTGIGLAMTKDYVKLMNGRVWAESAKGEGSTFFVSIPIEIVDKKTLESGPIKVTPKTIELDTEQEAYTNADGPIVLIVEDNVDLRHYIMDCLKNENYHLREANNGKEALQIAREVIPDVIISDIMMPEMNGNELCKTIKNQVATSHIPFVMLTAKASRENKIEGLDTGADDYLIKPFDKQELALKTRNLIKRQLLLQEKFKVDWRSEINAQQADKKTDPFIEQLERIVEMHLDNSELNVQQIGTEMGMSRMQLYRKTMAITGQSPTDFIRSIRIKKAAIFLYEDQYNVSEAAYAVGFNNLSYFTKCFKEMYGVTPSQYMKRA